MATSGLSNDTRNFQCVTVASVAVIKLPLRDILANHIQPQDLFKNIQSCATLKLRPDQLKICFIPPPDVPDYNKFDVTLLYTLIRNLCSLPRPAQGWGNEPTANDIQISDDIERLRLFRNNYYAHAESAVISDAVFKDVWRDLKLVFRRIHPKTGCSVDYEEELMNIERSKFTDDYLTTFRVLLETFAKLETQTDGRDEPDIFIQGENEIICGSTAEIEAEVKKVESTCWSITWQKRRGGVIKCIDTDMEKYSGSTKKKLVINSVCKEDEGEYQAVLSLESNGPEYKSRNIIRLHAIGDIPYVDIMGVTSGSEGIAIHYKCGALEQSPKVEQIEWSKNGQQLHNNSKKYAGGSVYDSWFTIMSATKDDRGNYSCKVINAVGSVSANIRLDIPSVEIFMDSPVCFGSETTIRSVISTSLPTPEKIEWQKSKDGADFYPIKYAKYPQSTDNSTCLSFIINNVSFDDKLYYRLLVWNGIGKGVSNAVYLNVTGSSPNITTSVDTNIKNRSVKLIGNLYFFDDSPGILETFWTKYDEKINTQESGEKLSEISNDYPSLTITNVGPDDAGEYQLTAINAVGSSTSEAIVLGLPRVCVKRVEREINGSQRITVTITSFPAPCHIQWSAKSKDDDSFTPVDVNAEEYKGTTVSFPHPVLVVTQKDQLNKIRHQVAVTNFIGKTVQDISGDIKSTERRKAIVENTFYKDRGARVRFTKLSNILAKQFPSQKLENLKFTLTNSNIVQNRVSVMEATSALECIRILQDEELFTQTDVIVMQFLCTQTDCLDLYAKCVEYAEQQKALCYFEKPPVNGYKNAQFHVQGDISNYTKQYIQEVIETVAAILDCKEGDILLNGVRHSTSFLLSLSVKESYIRKLLAMSEQHCLKLVGLDIDYLIIDKETIYLKRPKESDVHKSEKSTVGYSKLKNIPSQIGRKEPTQRNWGIFIPSGTESINPHLSTSFKQPVDIKNETIESLLHRLGIDDCKEAFNDNDIDLNLLLEMNESELRITLRDMKLPIGKQLRMCQEIKAMKSQLGLPNLKKSDEDVHDLSEIKRREMFSKYYNETRMMYRPPNAAELGLPNLKKSDEDVHDLSEIKRREMFSKYYNETRMMYRPPNAAGSHFTIDDKLSHQNAIRCNYCKTQNSLALCDICNIYSCKECEKKHFAVGFKEHRLVSLMTSGLKRKCSKHSMEVCDLYCKQCEIPSCIECISSGEHLGHKINNIPRALDTKKKALQRDLQELMDLIYPKYLDIATIISVRKFDLNQNSQKLTTAINNYGEDLHRELDHAIERLKLDLDIMNSKLLSLRDRQENEIASTISEIKQSVHHLNNLLTSKDISLLSDYKSRNDEFTRLLSTCTPTVDLPIFIPQIKQEQIYQEFGYISVPSSDTEKHGYTIDSLAGAESCPQDRLSIYVPRIITDINTDNGCTSASCLSDEKIWTCNLNDKIMSLYNLKGELINSIRSKSGYQPYDIAVIGNGNLVYTDSKEKTVNMVNNTEIQTVIRLHGWKPHGLCSTSSGDLLVVIISDAEKQTKVVRYSGSALKQSIQYNDMGQPLFSSGYNTKYLKENNNLDICVSDWSAGAVVVVNQAGNLRFTYTGPPSSSKESFRPVGITTDSQSRILTADLNKDCIHILDQDGQFLCYIKDWCLRLPWGLCVDTKDNLIVSEYNSRKVKIMQYHI